MIFIRFDIAIIGSGPAGLAASINSKIRNKNILLFGSNNLSNKLIKAPQIDNYLGFPSISGEKLASKFLAHIKELDINIIEKKVSNIYYMGGYFSIVSGDDMYEAKTVILCTGINFNKQIKNEDNFLGRGVSYCATCDAPLYRDRVVTVVGYNDESIEEANFLAEIASKVYFIPYSTTDLKDLNPSIEVIHDKVVDILGEQSVSSIQLSQKNLKTDALFIVRDSIAPKQLVPGLNADEHIIVNTDMETNIPGLFAAGDCVGKPYQYLKSAGQGQIAAMRAITFLNKVSA